MKAHAKWFKDFRRWFFNTSIDWSPSETNRLVAAKPASNLDAEQRHQPFALSTLQGNFMAPNNQSNATTAPESGPKPGPPRKAVDHTRSVESTDPAMPSDRDQKAGATGGAQSEVVRQAHRDVKGGMEDTSRGSESDAAYDKLKK